MSLVKLASACTKAMSRARSSQQHSVSKMQTQPPRVVSVGKFFGWTFLVALIVALLKAILTACNVLMIGKADNFLEEFNTEFAAFFEKAFIPILLIAVLASLIKVFSDLNRAYTDLLTESRRAAAVKSLSEAFGINTTLVAEAFKAAAKKSIIPADQLRRFRIDIEKLEDGFLISTDRNPPLAWLIYDLLSVLAAQMEVYRANRYGPRIRKENAFYFVRAPYDAIKAARNHLSTILAQATIGLTSTSPQALGDWSRFSRG